MTKSKKQLDSGPTPAIRENHKKSDTDLETIIALKTEAQNLRQIILKKMSKDGGHVSSPLGTIEIIQALLNVFDFTKDKIVFDVGHQMHAYKILTDRAGLFHTMDLKGGIGEYGNIHESPFDFYTGGHSGTAISAALGYSINHSEYKSIALIGDGSITGGQPFEALNQAGDIHSNILVIYNDNDYSVTENTGYLHSAKRLKEFSQSLGFEYIGAVDGHSTEVLIATLSDIKQKKCPVFLHIKTTKGKGYRPAEKDPVTFHWVEPFNLSTGQLKTVRENIFGKFIINKTHRLVEKYGELYLVSPASARSSGLNELKEIYPNYVFDTGMSEQHCVTFSASIALNKNKVICFIPATFLPRALDQIIDVCLLKISVVFVLLNPGIGATGPTHQGVYTFPLLNILPNVKLYNPSSLDEFDRLLDMTLEKAGPVFIQKPGENVRLVTSGDMVEMRQGKRLSVISLGNTLVQSLRLANTIGDIQVLHARKIIPIDINTLYSYVRRTKRVLILEDGLINSGVGQHIVAQLSEKGQFSFKVLGIGGRFPQIGTLQEVYEDIGLDDKAITSAAIKLIGE